MQISLEAAAGVPEQATLKAPRCCRPAAQAAQKPAAQPVPRAQLPAAAWGCCCLCPWLLLCLRDSCCRFCALWWPPWLGSEAAVGSDSGCQAAALGLALALAEQHLRCHEQAPAAPPGCTPQGVVRKAVLLTGRGVAAAASSMLRERQQLQHRRQTCRCS